MFVFKCLFACFQLQCIFHIVDKCDISMKNGKTKRKLFVHSFCSLSYYCQCFSAVVLCFAVVLLTSEVTQGVWAREHWDGGPLVIRITRVLHEDSLHFSSARVSGFYGHIGIPEL